VDARPQILEWGTLLDRINNPETRDFDAVLIGWRTEFRVDDTDLFHCDKINEPYQWVSHCDERLDVLLDTLPVIADPEAALPMWKEYQRLIAEQQPYTFVYFSERIHGVHERLQNVSPDARGDWVGIDRWWIAPRDRVR
jgi:peptide/nickel transport system substrate-binding protein